MSIQVPIITIDGPSGAGKTTLSTALAKTLGWHFLPSGSLYRCFAWYLIQNQGMDQPEVWIERFQSEPLRFEFANAWAIWVGDREVTEVLQDEAVAKCASEVAACPRVRQGLLARQIAYAQPPGLVAEGRDMATTVFPYAQLKIFLDASPVHRAERRQKQLGQQENIEQVAQSLMQRDQRDRSRACAPLVPADDAVIITTDDMSAQEVLATVISLWQDIRVK